MNFIILCIFFIIATTSQVSLANEDDNSPYHFRGNKPIRVSRKKCPTNSHWTKCYLGVECADTCEQYLSKKPVPDCLVKCDSKSQGGCECNNGYFLNDVGKCVLPNDCHLTNKPKKQICQAHERHITKAKKNCNELTCEHYWDMEAVFTERPKCEIGSCTCNIGYVRDEHGKCISVSACPESYEYKTITLKNADHNYDADSYTDGGTNKDDEDVNGTADHNDNNDSNGNDDADDKDSKNDKDDDYYDYQRE